MYKLCLRLGLAFSLMVLLSGCDVLTQLGILEEKVSPAADMLPELPGYKITEGELLMDYLSGFGEGAALLTGHPELAATITAVDYIIGCYQGLGAVNARVYSNEEMPLEAGAIAIADREALLDPINFFKCVQPAMDATGAQSVKIEPCTASYTLERDNNEFYILYAGTTENICQTFCANLEGCTAHK